MPKIPRKKILEHTEDGAIIRLEKSLAMSDAVEAVVKGHLALRQAELRFGVSKSALQRHVNKYKSLTAEEKTAYNYEQKFGFKRVFSDAEEAMLEQYLIDAANMCYGLTDMQARKLAFEFASANNKTYPNSWNENQCAGKEWMLGFRNRHYRLSLRTPEATSLSRATSFNKHNVSLFYKNLKEVIEKNKFQAGQIYNCDESGTTTVHKPRKVIAPTGQKQVGKVTSGERGILVTMCATICANGTFVAPFLVFPRTHFKSHMLNGAPPGTRGSACPTGWMTKDTFEQYLDHFIKETRCSKENKVLLILDNHESRFSINSLQKAKDNGIVMLTFPPHCSHRLQPLDIACFGPFKTYYNQAADNWMMTHPGTPISIYDIPHLIGIAFPKAFVPTNILKAFEHTGIHPYNSDIFTESDFLQSYVTDRPIEDCSGKNRPTEDTPIETSHEDQSVFNAPSSRRGDQEFPPSRTSNQDLPVPGTSNQDFSVPGTSNQDFSVPGTSNQDFSVPGTSNQGDNIFVTPCKGSNDIPRLVTPEELRPHAKAQPRVNKTRKGRKKGKSLVLTDTPVKNLIEAEIKERAEKKRQVVEKKKHRLEKKNLKKERRNLFNLKGSEESDSELDDDVVDLKDLCEDSSDNLEFSEEEREYEIFDPSVDEVQVGDFVLVKYTTKKTIKHFVGSVEEIFHEERECVVLFLKKGLSFRFFFPETKDLDTVEFDNIVAKLPKPLMSGGSERAALQLQFQFNFGQYSLG